MSSRRRFTWSKRHSHSETYYRTGGLLPIDTKEVESSNALDAKTISKAGHRQPLNLRIIPPDNKQFASSPVSAPYNAALAVAASNLQAAFNEMLRSPLTNTTPCRASVTIQKPLPSPPPFNSAPLTPNLPAELPGSLLQDNQGFPPCASPVETAPTQPSSQDSLREFDIPEEPLEDIANDSALVTFVPDLLTHAKSTPNMSARQSTVRSVRSGNALNTSTAAAQSGPLKVQHKKSLSDTSSRRRSKPNLVASPSSPESKLASCSVSANGDGSNHSSRARIGTSKLLQPSPMIVEGKTWQNNVESYASSRNELGGSTTPTPKTTRSRHIEELKGTITTQDQTISTLQAQFSSLRASHEAHVASLTDTHAAEVASLRNYARVFEEQLAKKPSLHHASSNNLLFLLDTTDPPQTPSRENSQNTAGSGSASSITSFQSALEKQQRSPQRVRNSPEMESLKRKLSATRRPETTNRNLLPELNQYRQNNVALQKQIESLMAKLNESKKNERALRTTLDEIEKKASKTEKLKKNVKALQNTIDHLENRLEAANVERLDAEEQLFNLQTQTSPFDLPKLEVPSSTANAEKKAAEGAHMCVSTICSSCSPISPEAESKELSTLAAFIGHIERLQDQVRQKDARIADLEMNQEQSQQKHDQLTQEKNETALQLAAHTEVLRKVQSTDAHIDQLRNAIIDREAIISEKEVSIRAVERQLEHHKLLLQAEIRKYATLKINDVVEDEPLPEITSLASQSDIDKWINKLHQRLRKERPLYQHGESMNSMEGQMQSMRQEIDFYIREIIYFKLDIKGYKSDIRKLKRGTTQLNTCGADLDSDTSSLKPTITPTQPSLAVTTSEFGASSTTSPILMGPASFSALPDRPVTPTLSTSALGMGFSPSRHNFQASRQLNVEIPRTPTRKSGTNLANGADIFDVGISPRSVARLSPERRKPTPPSPDREKFGDLLTNFPLSTPAAPRTYYRHRSMSDSVIQPYTTPRALGLSQSAHGSGTPVSNRHAVVYRGRSASASEASKSRFTPERPPRPRKSLFENIPAISPVPAPSPPPRVDVLTEAMRFSPDRAFSVGRPILQRNNSNSSVRIGTPSNTKTYQDKTASSPSSTLPAMQRSRAGSNASNISNNPFQNSPPTERKLSIASSSSIPFVIAMGSPHNPALTQLPILSPTTTKSPPTGPPTLDPPLKIVPMTSRTGLGGTMASSTPVTSPIQVTDASRASPTPPPKSTKPVSSTASVPPPRKLSFSRKQESQVPGPPRTPSHSRNVSGSSIRAVSRLVKKGEKESEKEKEEAHRKRKDSISMPSPLGSPFGGIRGRKGSAGSGGGVGEAL